MRTVQRLLSTIFREERTPKRIDGYKHIANVGVDLAIRPPLLEVLVDSLVADCRQQRHIGDASLLLLEPLLPVGLVGYRFSCDRRCGRG